MRSGASWNWKFRSNSSQTCTKHGPGENTSQPHDSILLQTLHLGKKAMRFGIMCNFYMRSFAFQILCGSFFASTVLLSRKILTDDIPRRLDSTRLDSIMWFWIHCLEKQPSLNLTQSPRTHAIFVLHQGRTLALDRGAAFGTGTLPVRMCWFLLWTSRDWHFLDGGILHRSMDRCVQRRRFLRWSNGLFLSGSAVHLRRFRNRHGCFG